MAHKEQVSFCLKVKNAYPNYFNNSSVLDVGSLDINGNNRYLFTNCNYLGLDLASGKNVGVVCPIHEFSTKIKFDVVICTEMLEHDKYFDKSLKKMIDLLKSKGLLIISCATTGRGEHGTHKVRPESSPGTNDFYKNRTIDDFLHDWFIQSFEYLEFGINNGRHKDLYLYGIKK